MLGVGVGRTVSSEDPGGVLSIEDVGGGTCGTDERSVGIDTFP